MAFETKNVLPNSV